MASWRREAREMWRAERKLLRNGEPLPQDLAIASTAIERLNKEIEDEDNRNGMAFSRSEG